MLSEQIWREIATATVQAPIDAVRVAAGIFVDRPHVVNRRLAGIEELATYHSVDEISEMASSGIAEDWVKLLSSYLETMKVLEPHENLGTTNQGWTIKIRELIPRSHDYFSVREAVVIDEKSGRIAFIPIGPCTGIVGCDHETASVNGEVGVDSDIIQDGGEQLAAVARRNPTATYAYRITWDSQSSSDSSEVFPESRIRIDVLQSVADMQSAEIHEGSLGWLRDKLMPKLVSWTAKVKPGDLLTSPQKSSLGLISVKRYTDVLLRLKAKYGQDLMENWTESTDPQKFVSEDLCIAAYLLTLWEVDRSDPACKMPSFVDLGCGNGLLVYILSSEGCPGTGIDVRERKIWNRFRPQAELEERTLDPSTSAFAEIDWIIGNHSDELTPWIPYIAAVSSYKCNFFLLPCCAFDFNQKFMKPGNESEYQSYFKYIRRICKEFGFTVAEDTLRIPSTKRSCFIGRGREYPEQDQQLRAIATHNFVQSRLRVGGKSFVVRPSGAEPIKNCTALPVLLKNEIIRTLSAQFLKTSNILDVPSGRWNAGKKIPLRQLAATLDSATLTALKSQCGGLQTFIRNHKYIFDIQDAEVQLRNYSVPHTSPSKAGKKSKRNGNFKTKSCWFHTFHPDGCPVDEILCEYSHALIPETLRN